MSSPALSAMREESALLRLITKKLSPLPATLQMSGAIADFTDLSSEVLSVTEEVRQLRGLIPDQDVDRFEGILREIVPTLRHLLIALIGDDRGYFASEPSLIVALDDSGAELLSLKPRTRAGIEEFLDTHGAAGEIFTLDTSLSLLQRFVSKDYKIPRTADDLVKYMSFVANAVFRLEASASLLEGVFGAAENLADQRPQSQPRQSILDALLGHNHLAVCSNAPQFAKLMLEELSAGEGVRGILARNLSHCQVSIESLRSSVEYLPRKICEDAAPEVKELPMIAKLSSAEFLERWQMLLKQGEILEPQKLELKLILES